MVNGRDGAAPAEPIRVTTTGKAGPIPEGSGLTVCHACNQLLLPGQFFTTMPIGPGADPEKRAKARARLPYSPVFLAFHWACMTGDDSESRLSIV